MSRPERADKIAALLAELAELLAEQGQPQIPAPRVSPEQTLLTVEEAAQRLRIGRTRMFALVKSGEIESVQIGRFRRIHPDAIEKFAHDLQNQKEKPDRRHVSSKDEAVVKRKVHDLEEERDNGIVRKAGQNWTVEQWLNHWLNNIVAPPSVTENACVRDRGSTVLDSGYRRTPTEEAGTGTPRKALPQTHARGAPTEVRVGAGQASGFGSSPPGAPDRSGCAQRGQAAQAHHGESG
jgi:excisionase family DNA binding protein